MVGQDDMLVSLLREGFQNRDTVRIAVPPGEITELCPDFLTENTGLISETQGFKKLLINLPALAPVSVWMLVLMGGLPGVPGKP